MQRALRVTRAREQRQILSDTERRLWYNLRDRRFLGYKFRRQVSIGPFIADFACKSARLIIETDGDRHGFDDQYERDVRRTLWLNKNGWRVLRFWNSELASDMNNVLERIFSALEDQPSP
jgi:very-short-patch-repair endonuclease